MASNELPTEYDHVTAKFKTAEELAADNIEYFVANDKQKYSADFLNSFHTIYNICSPLKISLDVIIQGCSRFDLNPHCKGNGYRSIITIVESCVDQIIEISKQIRKTRVKLFFVPYQRYAEIEAYAKLITRLLTLVQFAIILMGNSDRWLFPEETPKVTRIIDDLMGDFNNIDRDCFYGRTFGFQYAYTVRHALSMICVALAAYGDGYLRHNDTLSRGVSSFIHSPKYIINPEERGKRVAELSQGININFCKAFWSLTEEYGAQHAPLLVGPAMDVNEEFVIPPEDLHAVTISGKTICVNFPKFEGVEGVKARLLSSVWRDGQLHNVWNSNSAKGPLSGRPRQRSRYLMFHCHGGGFVAQSSKSHEIYLRYWAKELRMPILSIDYSLSPDAPFPQALNEIFFAYVWALNNLKKLGSTGNKIVFTGDSAGANLVTALVLKLIQHDIRLPESLVVAYPPYRVQYYPTPSRILCLMDPLLPLGVLKSCIQAYVGDLQASSESPRKLDVLKLAPHHNPFAVDFGDGNTSQNDLSGLNRSLSETNLDMIKGQLLDPVQYSDDEEYFSDCEIDFEASPSNSSILKDSEAQIDIGASEGMCYQNSKPKLRDDIKDAGGSLLQSLKSQFTIQVSDFTSRVSDKVTSSKVFDDLKTSVTKQIPPTVLDVSTKYFNDFKTGLTNYMYDRSSSRNDAAGSSNQMDRNEKDARKRSFPAVSPCISEESIGDGSTSEKPGKGTSAFSICHECLHPSTGCNCSKPWSGKIVSTQKKGLNYGSRHKLIKTKRKKLKDCVNKNFLPSGLPAFSSSESVINSDSDAKAVSDGSSSASNVSSEVFISAQSSASSLSGGTAAALPLSPPLLSLSDAGDFRNPLMSPIFASSDLLTKMPPTTILACSLDPLFDDSVDFIRKLQDLNKPAELYVLDQLPHGFLNFQVFSSEAREACDLMIACIRKSLHMGMGRTESYTLFANAE